MPFKIKKTVSSLAPSGNSVLFNGSNQNLRIANNAALQFGTGDFTVDFWLYGNTSQVAYARALSIGGTYGGSQIGLEVDIQGSSGLIMEVNSGASTVTSIVIYAPSTWKNQWNHIAVTRVGTTFYAFYNGTLAGSVTPASINLIGTDGVSIGCSTANANYWNGYISNLRLVKGTGLYTASFTPPTAPLTAISGTSLLVCQSPTIVDNSTNNFTITNNNAATVSSAVTPFIAPQSVFKIKKNNPNPTMLTGYGASFNGTNNIQTPSNAAFGFGTGDWTIEGWFYSANTGRLRLWSCSDNTDNFEQNTGGDIGYYNGSTTVWTGAGAVTSSTWYHFAAVRSSGTVTIYKNGTSILTQASTPNSSARYINIGGAVNTTYNGYISNFRVLKGTALYTSSFTPPTTPLTAIASCSLLACNTATFVDSSTNNFTLTNNSSVVASSSFTPFSSSLIVPTNYSVAFNGSNQYLTMPSTSSLAAGSGSFTYECWMYPTSVSSPRTMISSLVQLASPGDHGIYIKMQTNSTITGTIIQDNGTNLILTTSGTYALNTWHHVVLTRVGSNVSLFVNGTRTNTGTSNINSTENTIAIGKYYVLSGTVADLFNGYISNARVVIGGTQPYSPTLTTLTVPTTPLTAIANTSLLTCNAATIVDSSTNNLTLTNTGTATVSSTITPFSASVSNSGFKLKQVSYVRPNYMIATGGDLVTTSGSYKIHTFTTVGTSSFVVSAAGIAPTVECLLVGGGGGAGYWGGAGGGAGGVVYTASFTVSASSYNVVVGIGGSGSLQNNSNGVNGNNTLFGSLTALGGGGGGSANNPGASVGNSGGSGGGGGSWGGVTSAGGSGLQPASTSGGYGSNGGTSNGTSPYGAGGGGGAGGVGGNAAGSQTGNGGVGISNALLNSALVGQLYSGSYYVGGGGGAGGSSQGSARGLGGAGGGANGTPHGSGSGSNGMANTGGGGGGGQNDPTPAIGGSGGSGVVILKYRYTI